MSRTRKMGFWFVASVVSALVMGSWTIAKARDIPNEFRATYFPGGAHCEPNGCVGGPCCYLN